MISSVGTYLDRFDAVEILVGHNQHVAAVVLVLRLVVLLFGAAPRQKVPLAPQLRPQSGLVNHVARPPDADGLADLLVILHPIHMVHLKSVYERDYGG